MSRTVGRRKSNVKLISINKPPVSGPKLKFKWSISAAHLAAAEDNASIILPTIAPDRRQQRIQTVSSLSTNTHSLSQFSMCTQKSSTPNRAPNQCPSPVSVRSDKNSVQSCPLSLSFAQLHETRSTSPIRRRKKSRHSIVSVSDEKQDGSSIVSRKQSIISNASERRDSIAALNSNSSMIFNYSERRDSISALNNSPPIVSRLSEKRDSFSIFSFNPSAMSRISERRDSTSISNPHPSILSRKSMVTPNGFSVLANDRLVRLNTPQLRRLNVSEKYINEAKKLYYNADCKIFTPRMSVAQVS